MDTTGLPHWWLELRKRHDPGINRVFILHNNVNDLVYHAQDKEKGTENTDSYYDTPHPFRDLLLHILATDGGFGPILFYSPTSPLSLFFINSDGKHTNIFVDPDKLRTETDKLFSGDYNQEDSHLWKKFAKAVQTEKRVLQEKLDVLFAIEPVLEQYSSAFKIAFIMDFFEKITTTQENVADFQAEEIVRKWALSDSIKQSRNLIIGMTVEHSMLPGTITSSSSNIHGIEVSMPGPEDRLNFLDFWSRPSFSMGTSIVELGGGFVPSDREDGMDSQQIQQGRRESLAGLSRGFRLVNLDAMCRMATVETEGIITDQLFRQFKQIIIREESRNLLEEIEPKHSFDDIGGLEYAKKHFRNVANKLISSAAVSRLPKGQSVPKGILLAGPPGTGKTILAEALARNTGMTLVKLGNIRASRLGESERNLARALSLIEKMAPVVVFVDEIDQSFGSRSTGHEGDSGVDRRIFGKLLEFMGDNTKRGKVLWIAASNRPDLLDEAMKSRFDTVMAILPPYESEECKKILLTMEHRIPGLRYADALTNEIDKYVQKIAGMPGRAIETLVRKAVDIAGEEGLDGEIVLESHHIDRAMKLFKPNIDQREVDRQTINAVMAVNFTDMMPSDPMMYPPHLRPAIQEAIGQEGMKSNTSLARYLDKLQGKWVSNNN